ncbi:thermonuclease family protein [Liberiplasma polymorphum]|uniref:thermonuclease family protein n=1 Tax=Liberiplasma polymorphum TaxID=3374570 RepID=UPI003773243D
MKKLLLTLLFIFFVGVLSACQTETDNTQTTPQLNSDRSDALRLERDYEGYDFIEDGIGEVELVNCLTGHSTEFKELDNDVVFRTRYLGVATPAPYTNPPRPWSLAVTDYVCFVLTNAVRIVLEADPESPRRDGTSWGRYLVYVWYDNGQGELRNLNLELIELAFTAYTGNSSLYGDIFRDAWFHAQSTNRRIWGEEDPDPRTGD